MRYVVKMLLPVAVSIDINGTITDARVHIEHHEIKALVEADTEKVEAIKAKIVEATRSRMDEGLVRVMRGVSGLTYKKFLKATKHHFIVEDGEAKIPGRAAPQQKFSRRGGYDIVRGQTWSVGSTARIHPDDLKALQEKHGT